MTLCLLQSMMENFILWEITALTLAQNSQLELYLVIECSALGMQLLLVFKQELLRALLVLTALQNIQS